MKHLVHLKAAIFMLTFSPAMLLAVEVPSNSLQVAYKKNNEQITKNTLKVNDTHKIHNDTYNYLNEIFSSFYQKITFTNEIADSTFVANAHYELISIPLIAENKNGLQFELFGNFSNPATQQFSNISEDQPLSNYYANTEALDIYDSELSLGAGMSFYTEGGDKIKIIISNNKIPGYGNSTALIGFETSF